MTGPIVIRPGASADAAEVAALHIASLRSSYTATLPTEALADGQLLGRAEQWRELWPLRLGVDYGSPADTPVLLLAQDQDELIGFAYLVPEGDGRSLLDALHVRPGRTGQGLGTRLLHAALAATRELHLDVLAANTRALAFYEREGGVRTAERPTVLADGSEALEYEYTWPSVR